MDCGRPEVSSVQSSVSPSHDTEREGLGVKMLSSKVFGPVRAAASLRQRSSVIAAAPHCRWFPRHTDIVRSSAQRGGARGAATLLHNFFSNLFQHVGTHEPRSLGVGDRLNTAMHVTGFSMHSREWEVKDFLAGCSQVVSRVNELVNEKRYEEIAALMVPGPGRNSQDIQRDIDSWLVHRSSDLESRFSIKCELAGKGLIEAFVFMPHSVKVEELRLRPIDHEEVMLRFLFPSSRAYFIPEDWHQMTENAKRGKFSVYAKVSFPCTVNFYSQDAGAEDKGQYDGESPMGEDTIHTHAFVYLENRVFPDEKTFDLRLDDWRLMSFSLAGVLEFLSPGPSAPENASGSVTSEHQ